MIYFDHAATSYPKPKAVLAAIEHWYRNVGVSAERGEGPRTREAAAVVQRVRDGIAKMTGHSCERVAFCSGATEGLNLVLRALLTPGSRVLTTAFEHASVVRPLISLRDERDLQVAVADCDATDCGANGGLNDDALCAAIAKHRPATLVFTHASNVTGEVFDAARICQTAREHGTVTVLDVSQTAGYLRLDVGADVVIGSGHKAMHGPPGIGFVAVAAELDLKPQKFGGTGSSAALERHPTAWPQAFEAGTPNTPALFGLAAAMDWLQEQGEANLLQRSLRNLAEVEAGLRGMPDIRVIAADPDSRMPVLSFLHASYDPAEVGAILAQSGMQARAGFHCAPWVHQHLGTSTAGTVRIATGPDTTDDEIRALLALLATL